MTVMEPNVPLLRKVWEHVKDEPPDYYQGAWVRNRRTECGTSYCFAGHALVMSGHKLTVMEAWDDEYYLDGERATGVNIAAAAAKELGISHEDADRLFWGSNSLESVTKIVSGLIKEDLIL